MDISFINPIKADILSMEKIKLLIIGAGELGRQVNHYAGVDGRYECVGFVDDFHEVGETIDGRKVIGNISDIGALWKQNVFDELFIAFGYKCLLEKQSLYDSLKDKYKFATIIAAPQYIDSTSHIGEDVLIYPGVIIDKETYIGDNTIINLGSVISHNTSIGMSCFIGGNVSIAGFVNIGNNNFIGIGATIIDNTSICNNNIIGAGTLIIKNISMSGKYVGTPARRL